MNHSFVLGGALVANSGCLSSISLCRSLNIPPTGADPDPGASPSPKSALELKNASNRLYLAKKYFQAGQGYTAALKMMIEHVGGGGGGAGGDPNPNHPNSQQIIIDILSNRAAAYLGLRFFHKALEDTETVLALDPGHFKGNFRKAKALLGLERCADAISLLEKQISDIGNGNSGKSDEEISEMKKLLSELLTDATGLLKQQTTGEYDMAKFYGMNAFSNPQPNFVDFTQRVKLIPVVSGPGPGARRQGQRLVSTEEILPGQLVMACRAFATALPKDPGEHLDFLNLDPGTDCLSCHRKLNLGLNIFDKIFSESGCHEAQIFQLCIGGLGPEFEKFRAAFSLKNDSSKAQDLDAIIHNCIHRALKFEESGNPYASRDHVDAYLGMPGFWILPAYMKHSCWDSNSTYLRAGDVLFVRAFKKISPGDEISTFHVCPDLPYAKRVQRFAEIGLDSCDCQLCQVDEDKTSWAGRKRTKLLDRVEQVLESNNEQDMKSLADELQGNNFKDFLDPRMAPSMVNLLAALGEKYFKRNEFEKCEQVLKRAHWMAMDSPLMYLCGPSMSLKLAECCIGVRDEFGLSLWDDMNENQNFIISGMMNLMKV